MDQNPRNDFFTLWHYLCYLGTLLSQVTFASRFGSSVKAPLDGGPPHRASSLSVKRASLALVLSQSSLSRFASEVPSHLVRGPTTPSLPPSTFVLRRRRDAIAPSLNFDPIVIIFAILMGREIGSGGAPSFPPSPFEIRAAAAFFTTERGSGIESRRSC